ncbi:MAG: hypothetical protein H7832_07440 [Magnetococcus sp. DMHC-6]
MRRRFAVLLLHPDHFRQKRPWLEPYWIFPHSRAGVYQDWLVGQSIPHHALPAKALTETFLLDGDQLRFSAILLALPWKKLSLAIRTLLLNFSRQYGLSLIADVALLTDTMALAAFGVHDRGRRHLAPALLHTPQGNILFTRHSRPFSPSGADVGLRPLGRFLWQNWSLHHIKYTCDTRILAQWRGGMAAILDHMFGEAHNILFNFHPALLLHHPAPLHLFLRQTIEQTTPAKAARWCWQGAMALRMDDPGSSERVFLEGYNDGVPTATLWQEVLHLLEKEKAHLNVAMVPHWVDDGDLKRGRLFIAGSEATQRQAADHHLSQEVVYKRLCPALVYDYAALFAAMIPGIVSGLITPLSHGLTHLTPNERQWSRAQDRYTHSHWYREFGGPDHELYDAELLRRLRLSADRIEDWCGRRPHVFVPSGHERTPRTPLLAQQAGYWLLSSRGTIPLTAPPYTENRFLPGCYPEQMAHLLAWSAAGYPATLVFHDFDLVRGEVVWLAALLTQLKKNGMHRFFSLDSFAWSLHCHLDVETRTDGVVQIHLHVNHSLAKSADILWIRVGMVASRVTDGVGEEVAGWVIDGHETLLPIDPTHPPTCFYLHGLA